MKLLEQFKLKFEAEGTTRAKKIRNIGGAHQLTVASLSLSSAQREGDISLDDYDEDEDEMDDEDEDDDEYDDEDDEDEEEDGDDEDEEDDDDDEDDEENPATFVGERPDKPLAESIVN